jgi:hypothetical protein
VKRKEDRLKKQAEKAVANEQREKKRALKGQSTTEPKRKKGKGNRNNWKEGKEPLPKHKLPEQRSADDQALYCGRCDGYYYDDDSDDEDWYQCTSCQFWFHESCTGCLGRGLSTFVCLECN